MSALALGLGALIFLLLADRLRHINWQTTKPEYVAKYLAQALWTLGLFDSAARGHVELYQFGAIIAALIWLTLSRKYWVNGTPPHMQKDAP